MSLPVISKNSDIESDVLNFNSSDRDRPVRP